MLGVVMSPKQVCGDQGLDWDQPLLQSATAELSKPSFMRRQQPRQQQPESLKCPRCGSTDTKFCYYNNYNKSQPRHLCKSCKRHWTNGGTLRNVPVGGVRKNKRPRSSTASAMAVVATSTDQGCWKIPVTNAGSDQKSVANILYGTLIPSSSPPLQETRDSITFSMTGEPFLGSNGMNTIPGLNESAAAQIPTEEFPFSSLSSFEENVPLINPDSHQSSSHHIDYYSGHLDSMEKSAFDAPWPGPSISTGVDLPNYWDWNEINVLNSSADLNIAWDDVYAETKT